MKLWVTELLWVKAKNSPVKWCWLSLSFTTKHNLLAFLQRVHREYDAARLLGDNGSLQYIVHCQRKINREVINREMISKFSSHNANLSKLLEREDHKEHINWRLTPLPRQQFQESFFLCQFSLHFSQYCSGSVTTNKWIHTAVVCCCV